MLFCSQRHAKREVLEVIRNTRESIQLLRSQLHDDKSTNKDCREQQEIRG